MRGDRYCATFVHEFLLWIAVRWNRNLTYLRHWQMNSPKDNKRGRAQFCSIRGINSHALSCHPVWPFSCVGCRDIGQKVELLTKMTDEVTKQQVEREDTALQQKRYFQIGWDTCIWQCYYLYTIDHSLIVLGVQVDGTENWPTYGNDCWTHQKISGLGETLALQDGGTIMAVI